MKVFIVFISLLVINVGYLSYQGDMYKFLQKQADLKSLAEECAGGSAAILDLEEYALGRLVFDYERGIEFSNNLISYTLKSWNPSGLVEYELVFEDDYRGYEANNISKKPAVTAILIFKTDDLFDLPFIQVNTIKRIARYELE